MPSTKNYVVLLNEFAGGGQSKAAWPKLAQRLNQHLINYQLYRTEYPGHATKLAYKLAQEAPADTILIVVGGDGTLHEALNGLQQIPKNTIILAYIPCGSGNDFARGAGISRQPLTALEQLLKVRQPRTFDVGHYQEALAHEHGFFMNNIGIGFDAAVVHATNRAPSKRYLNKYHLGSLAYIVSLVGTFFRQQAFPVKITSQQTTTEFKRAFLVTTTNHPYFGGGVPIMPSASMHDHKLDLVVMERVNTLYFIFLFIMMFLHLHTHFKAVHHFKAEELRIQTASPEFGQADGENMGKRAFDITFDVHHQRFLC
ncbi:diacylglycerol/lipid kinase family protein [Loigolactobacillus backii]|uniref:Diacylglycerol kinase n=1 Tax=Loigolactobacillus backii TaxID=375175 RepID=A0A192H4I3_9LACO|nr:diacylglycerol kinase family protein [Loigolactobacillus backii]ANK59721.1 diacylglycerol kinase [Loigolactobacillus backii]ANK63122.1 diacylglycerol kinase [Loigolactobacillus backii]ANK64716.1 diacylglycerol kinase [Loigolactobacillus backii]ANK66835.1 diacylglycerol kinase [Loigolactobacillus backii]ANK69870.1 diacylglycerol kinase [Loigolactobacillus backii]